jgi:hypothetical protein
LIPFTIYDLRFTIIVYGFMTLNQGQIHAVPSTGIGISRSSQGEPSREPFTPTDNCTILFRSGLPVGVAHIAVDSRSDEGTSGYGDVGFFEPAGR